jgi:hypothetical protein
MPDILTVGPVDTLVATHFDFRTNSHSNQFRTAQATRPSTINNSEDEDQALSKDLGTLCILKDNAALTVAVDDLNCKIFKCRPTIVYTAKEGPIEGTVDFEVRGHLFTSGPHMQDTLESHPNATCATMEHVEELHNQAFAICHQEVLSAFATTGIPSMYLLDQTQYHLLNRLEAKIVMDVRVEETNFVSAPAMGVVRASLPSAIKCTSIDGSSGSIVCSITLDSWTGEEPGTGNVQYIQRVYITNLCVSDHEDIALVTSFTSNFLDLVNDSLEAASDIFTGVQDNRAETPVLFLPENQRSTWRSVYEMIKAYHECALECMSSMIKTERFSASWESVKEVPVDCGEAGRGSGDVHHGTFRFISDEVVPS